MNLANSRSLKGQPNACSKRGNRPLFDSRSPYVTISKLKLSCSDFRNEKARSLFNGCSCVVFSVRSQRAPHCRQLELHTSKKCATIQYDLLQCASHFNSRWLTGWVGGEVIAKLEALIRIVNRNGNWGEKS